LGSLALVLFATNLLAVQELQSILVELQLGDDTVGRVDTNVDDLLVDLLTSQVLDVDNKLASVARGNLAGNSVATTNNHNLIISADGDGTHTILLSQVLGESGAHDDAALVGRSTEVSLSAFSAGGANSVGALQGHS